MTSSVKYTAHCSGSKRLYVCTTHVDHTGTPRKEEHWLKDGESMEVTVYESKRTHAFEVDANTVPADYSPSNRPSTPPPNVTAPVDPDPTVPGFDTDPVDSSAGD